MTDTNKETITETEDDLIPVETPLEDQTDDDDSDDEDDTSDERLGDSEEDNDDEISSNRKRRQKRREVQKKAKERSERELAMLRQQVADLQRRQGQVEGHVVSTNEQSLAQRLAAAQREVEMAEQVIAKATAAGNGNDVVQAMRIRDAAIDNARQLAGAKQQFEQAKGQPQIAPEVANYANQWVAANPWYDPTGRDRDSAVTKAIDNELASEGYNPATREYWEELTARVADAFGTTSGNAAPAAQPVDKSKRKTPPPTGGTREHAPASTKREIYVTPERKQAMIDAGVWDDPSARQRYLKAYRDYDSSAR
jgi:hypothetical protein